MLAGRTRAARLVRPCCRPRRWLATTRTLLLDLLDLPPGAPREHVRRCYLRALMQTHPDHSTSPDAAEEMMVLREAWEHYLHTERGEGDKDGFTAFGVGCSFSDSADEQRERAEVTEMASRGKMNQRKLADSVRTAVSGRDCGE